MDWMDGLAFEKCIAISAYLLGFPFDIDKISSSLSLNPVYSSTLYCETCTLLPPQRREAFAYAPLTYTKVPSPCSVALLSAVRQSTASRTRPSTTT